MAVDRALLDRQLAELPESARWAVRPEVQDLANLLTPGERVVTGVTGWLIESGKLAMRTWLIIATSQRLFCLRKVGDAGLRKVEMPISVMRAAYTDARLGYHEVIVESSGPKIVVSGMAKESAVLLAAALNAQMQVTKERRNEVTKERSNEATLEREMEDADQAALMPAEVPTLVNIAVVAGQEVVSRAEVTALAEQVQRLEAELQHARKRLAAVEDVIRKAAARAAANAQAKAP